MGLCVCPVVKSIHFPRAGARSLSETLIRGSAPTPVGVRSCTRRCKMRVLWALFSWNTTNLSGVFQDPRNAKFHLVKLRLLCYRPPVVNWLLKMQAADEAERACKSRSAQLWTKTDRFITPPVNRIRSGGLPAHLSVHPSFSAARPRRRVARSYIIRTLTACEEESYCQGSARASGHARLRFGGCAETLLALLVNTSLWDGIAASRQKVGLCLSQCGYFPTVIIISSKIVSLATEIIIMKIFILSPQWSTRQINTKI